MQSGIIPVLFARKSLTKNLFRSYNFAEHFSRLFRRDRHVNTVFPDRIIAW